MKGSIALAAVPVLAALAAPAGGGTAYAEEPAPSADLRMVYGNPEIATDSSGVTWRWTLTNTGAASAQAVVATHKISADQKVFGVSQPCAGAGGDIVCRFPELRPGERRVGWIRTSVARPGGTLHVNAQVTWHEIPGGLAPPVVDPGIPGAFPQGPRTESWGVADADANWVPRADMPGRSG